MRDTENNRAVQRAIEAFSRTGYTAVSDSARQLAQAFRRVGELTGREFADLGEKSQEKERGRSTTTEVQSEEKGKVKGTLQSTAKTRRVRIARKSSTDHVSKSYEAGFNSGRTEGYKEGHTRGMEDYKNSQSPSTPKRIDRSLPPAPTFTPGHGIKSYGYQYGFEIERDVGSRRGYLCSLVTRYSSDKGVRRYQIRSMIEEDYRMREQGIDYRSTIYVLSTVVRSVAWYVDIASYMEALVAFLQNLQNIRSPETLLGEELMGRAPETIVLDIRNHMDMIPEDDTRERQYEV